MNLFFYLDFYFKLFLHCNPKRSHFLYFVLLKTQPFVKRKPVKKEKNTERSRSVLGRFYCICCESTIKFTLSKAMKDKWGGGLRYSSTLPLTSVPDGGEGGKLHTPATLQLQKRRSTKHAGHSAG